LFLKGIYNLDKSESEVLSWNIDHLMPTHTLYPSHKVLQLPPSLTLGFHVSKSVLEMEYFFVMTSQFSWSATLCHLLQPQMGDGCGFTGAFGLQSFGSSVFKSVLFLTEYRASLIPYQHNSTVR
jgi:hypothetical protein